MAKAIWAAEDGARDRTPGLRALRLFPMGKTLSLDLDPPEPQGVGGLECATW